MSIPASIFTSPAGRAAFVKAYEAVLDMWQVEIEPLAVQTRSGVTHINACGPPDAQPLFLFHAAGVSSASWYANAQALSRNFRVYAVDTLGDAGKSVLQEPFTSRAEYASWLKDVFNVLGVRRAHIAGHSYGGWLALNLALSYPKRLKKVVLLAPAASIHPFKLGISLTLHLSNLVPRWKPSAKRTLEMQAANGYQFDENFLQMMEIVNQHARPKMMFPTVYSDEELRKIKEPTLLLIGEQEKIYNPEAAMKRAASLIPNIKTDMVSNAGHTLIMEQAEDVNTRILEFLS